MARAHGSRDRRPGHPEAAGLSVLVAGAILLSAAIGYTVARSSNAGISAALPVRHATAGIVQVSYASDWRRTSTRGASSLGMRHEVTLTAKRPDGGQLTIGEETDFNPGTRSTPLLAALRRAPTPQIVKLGSLNSYRYPDLRPPGAASPEFVYALRTSRLAAACAPNSPAVERLSGARDSAHARRR